MNVVRYPLGQMQANCYLLTQDADCLLIDPGDSADFILEKITEKRLTLRAVIATHGHFDHIMAVGEIQASYPTIPFLIHSKDLFLLDRVIEAARHFLDYDPLVIPIGNIAPLKKGSCSIGAFRFDVIETPGHTPGGCSLHFLDEHIVFTGDTLFADGIGRYDFSYSDRNELRESLHRLFKLPGGTVVYSGHGEESTIEQCKKTYDRQPI